MLLALPIAAFLALWAVMARIGLGAHDGGAVGRAGPAVLGALSLWGAFLALSSEGLSLLNHLTRLGVGLAWAVGLMAVVAVALRTHVPAALADAWRRRRRPTFSSWEWGLIGLTSASLGVLLVIAVLAPPNTTDSLQYHMVRVVEWQQNATLSFFPTAYYPQLWNSIWAEETILHLKLLSGTDQLVNLVQWLSLVGSLVAVVAIVDLLGGGRMAKWLASAFALSLPIGILEATSTQTDYVAGLWLLVLVYFTALSKQRRLSRLEWLCLASALGLGLLTKATLYLYAFPIVVWLLVPFLAKGRWRSGIFKGVELAAGVVFLNLGYWGRNLVAFGGPLGSTGWVQQKTVVGSNPGFLITHLTRQILLNFATPSTSINGAIVSWERTLQGVLDPQASAFNLIWSWNHEDLAGNPIHVAIIGASLLAAIWLWRRKHDKHDGRVFFQYVLAGVASAFVFAEVAAFDVYGVRYQLPAFLLFAPVVGYVGQRLLPGRLAAAAAFGLILISFPWLLFNQTRPLIGWQPRTRVQSVLTESRSKVLFANWPKLRQPYEAAAATVAQTSCRQVGLVVDSHDPEYLLWASLGAPENGMRLEVLDPLKLSARFADPAFHPCAVICTICGRDRTQWNGLPLAGDFDMVRVYAAGSG